MNANWYDSLVNANWYESLMDTLSLWWWEVSRAAESYWATWLKWTQKWPELWYVGGITLAVVLLALFVLVGLYYYWHIRLPRRARKAEKRCRKALDAFQNQWRRLGGNPDRDPMCLMVSAVYQEALRSAGEVWRTWFLWRHRVTRQWLNYQDSPRNHMSNKMERYCKPDDLLVNKADAAKTGSIAMQEIGQRWPVSRELHDLAKRAVNNLVPLTERMWIPYGGCADVYGYLWLRLVFRGACVPGDKAWLHKLGLFGIEEIKAQSQINLECKRQPERQQERHAIGEAILSG